MTAGKRAVTADTVASWMSCVDQAQADGLVHIPEPIAGFLDFCSGASPAHALARSGTSLARRDARWPEGAPGPCRRCWQFLAYFGTLQKHLTEMVVDGGRA